MAGAGRPPAWYASVPHSYTDSNAPTIGSYHEPRRRPSAVELPTIESTWTRTLYGWRANLISAGKTICSAGTLCGSRSTPPLASMSSASNAATTRSTSSCVGGGSFVSKSVSSAVNFSIGTFPCAVLPS